jgi:hypothetical protein
MLEKDIEKYLTSKVKALKGKAYKWVSPGNAGVPDRIVMIPGGRIAFVELKAPGKKPSPLQLVQHKKLGGLGFNVYVLDSKEGIDEFLGWTQW